MINSYYVKKIITEIINDLLVIVLFVNLTLKERMINFLCHFWSAFTNRDIQQVKFHTNNKKMAAEF